MPRARASEISSLFYQLRACVGAASASTATISEPRGALFIGQLRARKIRHRFNAFAFLWPQKSESSEVWLHVVQETPAGWRYASRPVERTSDGTSVVAFSEVRSDCRSPDGFGCSSQFLALRILADDSLEAIMDRVELQSINRSQNRSPSSVGGKRPGMRTPHDLLQFIEVQQGQLSINDDQRRQNCSLVMEFLRTQ